MATLAPIPGANAVVMMLSSRANVDVNRMRILSNWDAFPAAQAADGARVTALEAENAAAGIRIARLEAALARANIPV